MKLLTIFNLTSAFPCCIFAMKQIIEIMKAKVIMSILIISGLCLLTPTKGMSQEQLFRAHAAEIVPDIPAQSCFLPTFAGFHFRNDFGMKEMMYADIIGVLNFRKNILFFCVNHYGYASYGDFKLSVGYGRNFGDRFAMTARVFYMMSHARGYPARHSVCADFAFAYKVSPKLLFDAVVFNPFLLRYGIVGQDVIPLRFALGCTYMPVRKLLLSLIMSKSLPGAWEVTGRIKTHPIAPLLLGADCSNNHLGVYIGLLYKKFLVSVQAKWYYRISVSPEIGGGWFDAPKR